MSDHAARERVFDLTPEMLFRRGKSANRVWAAIARTAGSVRPQDPHRPPLGTSRLQQAKMLMHRGAA